MPSWLKCVVALSGGLSRKKSAVCSFTWCGGPQANEQINANNLSEISTNAILSMHSISRCELLKNIVMFSNAMLYKLGYILS